MKYLITGLVVSIASSIATPLLAEDSSSPGFPGASSSRDSLFSIYGINAKTDEDQSSSNGLGIYYNTETLKAKAEGTSDFYKLGAAVKLNPFSDKVYTKFGLSYVNQKMYAPDSSSQQAFMPIRDGL